MTMRVKLSKDKNRIDFDLIQVTDIYRNIGTLVATGKGIYTSNDWMFHVGYTFNINKLHKICCIPKRTNKSKTSLIFDNEGERYDFLKSFHSALYEWSGNEFFKTKKVFKPIPDIKYHDNIWIIF